MGCKVGVCTAHAEQAHSAGMNVQRKFPLPQLVGRARCVFLCCPTGPKLPMPWDNQNYLGGGAPHISRGEDRLPRIFKSDDRDASFKLWNTHGHAKNHSVKQPTGAFSGPWRALGCAKRSVVSL
eukprot:6179941-Pleurochrysis_carterae.AAC.2